MTLTPTSVRGTWTSETALRRLRRCLGFLRSGDFISASEQVKILRRVARWKSKHALRKVVVRKPEAARPSAMRDTIAERFRQFHFDNPLVFELIVKLAQEQYRRGKERVGIKALWEQIRWHMFLGKLRIRGEYTLNNDFTSRYVRMLIEKYPAYRGLFELRVLRAP
jgi:hypothetical protein